MNPVLLSHSDDFVDDLDRLLSSVGKAVFVRFYAQFADPRVADSEILEILSREYTLAASRTRTSKARKIFRDGLQREALERIASSERTDPEASARAARLLRDP